MPKTYEEFCETEKDEEAVMDYLEKCGYLLRCPHGDRLQKQPPGSAHAPGLAPFRMTSSRMSFSES